MGETDSSGENVGYRLNNFIADDPLYRWFDLGSLFGDLSQHNPGSVISRPKIYRYCSYPECRTERPFDPLTGPDGNHFHLEASIDVEFSNEVPSGVYGEVYAFSYLCTGCNISVFRCWVEIDPLWRQGSKMRIRKVGQVPPRDISIPTDLEDAFGEDARLYKNALVCMSQSYGMASCAYLRRILENRITPLLSTLSEIRREEGADADLHKIEEAMRERTTEKRIRLANEALPDSLRIAGANPLSLIYARLSDALHRSDDQECMEVAERASKILEHVVTNLRAVRRQQIERQEYEGRLRALQEGLE